MRAEQWRALADLALQAFRESATEHDYVPLYGAVYAAAISELKRAEREESKTHDHSS